MQVGGKPAVHAGCYMAASALHGRGSVPCPYPETIDSSVHASVRTTRAVPPTCSIESSASSCVCRVGTLPLKPLSFTSSTVSPMLREGGT